MKKISIIMTVALCAILMASCGDDLLEKNPPSQPSQSSFWLRESDFQNALAACYSSVYSWPGVMSEIISFYDGLTDNSNTQYDESTYGSTRTIAQGDLTPNTGGYVYYVYHDSYVTLGRIHQLLEHLDAYQGGDMTEATKKQIIAECKAMRAYVYSYLYECYREVPLVLKTLSTADMYDQPKASRDEIRTQILKDYDDAIANLQDGVYSDAALQGHFTVGAVKALKARLMLFDAYDENGNAIKSKMQEIIPILESIKGYCLAPSMRDNFVTTKQDASPEIMYSVKYLAPNYINDLDLYHGSWAAQEPTRNLVDAFECTDGKPWSESPLAVHPDESKLKDTGGSSSDELRAEREKLFQNRDRRLKETLSHSGILRFPEYDDNSDAPTQSSFSTGFTLIKLVQPTKSIPDYSTVCEADIVVVRYAHVLLMLAEAENEANGPTDKALNAINQVRNRSGQPSIESGITQAELRERIRNEWRVETAFEGLRYFQLKRWHQLEQKVNGFSDPSISGYIKVFKPAFYFFPIPQGEIDKAGGKLEQDPNYK